MARALVTGASGFLGLPIVRGLSARGYEVHAVHCTAAVRSDVPAEWHQADLLQPLIGRRLIENLKPEVLVHAAWETKHGSFWETPLNHAWAAATFDLAQAFAGTGGRRFVGIGSCAEYSWCDLQAGIALREEHPRMPASLYGAAKNASFERVSELFGHMGVSFAWGRLFLTYGPGDLRSTLLSSLIQSLLNCQQAPLTAGTQVRDFIYVDDAAAALVALADTTENGAFNIATGTGSSVASVALLAAREAGHPDLLDFGALPPRDGDPPWLVGSPQRIRSLTGWAPAVTLEEGIRETVRWWREHR